MDDIFFILISYTTKNFNGIPISLRTDLKWYNIKLQKINSKI